MPSPATRLIGERADLAIVLGGDGTMLTAGTAAGRFDVPLVGVNQGRLGFMTDIALDDMIGSVSRPAGGQVFKREQRFLLDAEVLRGGKASSDAGPQRRGGEQGRDLAA
jgi:NAD+ kinase